MDAASFGRGPAADAPILILMVGVGLAVVFYCFVKDWSDGKRLKTIASELHSNMRQGAHEQDSF